MKFPIYSPVRKIAGSASNVYLTFDDGPSPDLTPKVLQILKKNSIRATFFIVTEKAKKYPEIVKQILADGHSIGDHSLDHKFSRYFATHKQTRKWIETSQNELTVLCNTKPVAFRSPAGIWTPKLAKALKELSIPWIHWNIRFFDTRVALTNKLIDKKLREIVPGSIVLLHDEQSTKRADSFLAGLSYLIQRLKGNGLTPEKL